MQVVGEEKVDQVDLVDQVVPVVDLAVHMLVVMETLLLSVRLKEMMVV